MNSYNYSYNVLINRLEAFAAGHFLIKRFTHGQIDLADMDQDEQYPFMHVVPNNITPVDGGMQFDFQIIFADIPRDKELKAEYQREVISDCVRLAQDLIAEVKNGLQLFGFDVQLVTNPTIEPFMEEYKNTLTGVTFSLQLEVPWDWSACDIPATWSVGGASGSGGSGTGYGIVLRTNGVDNVVQNILDLVEGTNVTITDNGDGSVTIDAAGGGGGGEYVSTEYNVNHITALGNSYVIGDRVWYNGSVYRCIANNDAINPSNPTYWTLQSVGYRLRQSPVDWNASSGDYQIINKPTLATVATTGDYNDLDNLPTIPAAQVNSDWNSVSGVSQILNKPTIPAAQVNSDWNAVSGVAEILNKPTIPDASLLVPYTGATNSVDLGNHSLTADDGAYNTEVNPAFFGVQNAAVTKFAVLDESGLTVTDTVAGDVMNLNAGGLTFPDATAQYTAAPVNLDDLDDVNAPTPSNGQVLAYNTTTSEWEAVTPSAPTPTGYYGAFQDNTTQTAAVANTAYAVKLNTTDLTNGVSVVNDGSGNPTRVTLANTGIYNIQFSLQLEKTGGSGNFTVDVWVRKNGVDIPNTTGKVVLTGSANASPVVAAWNYVLDLAANDYVQLMWSTSNNNAIILAATATAPHPGIPSAILTVTQQAGIMAGTGITAINSLTGAAQSLVVGTGGTDFDVSSLGTTHTFNLPTASAANRGALSSTDWSTFNGKLTGNAPITGATNTKITYDSKGLVTAGTSLAAADLPTGINAANIGSGAVSNTEFGYLDGVTSAIQTQLDNKKDSFTIRMGVGPAAPADNTTYYFGEAALSLSTVATLWDNKIAFACRLVGAQIMANNSTGTATAETSTLYLRINNTTDVLLSNAVVFTGVPPTSTSYTVTGLSQTIAANDELTIKWVTPTWATNPANAQFVVTLFFERT